MDTVDSCQNPTNIQITVAKNHAVTPHGYACGPIPLSENGQHVPLDVVQNHLFLTEHYDVVQSTSVMDPSLQSLMEVAFEFVNRKCNKVDTKRQMHYVDLGTTGR